MIEPEQTDVALLLARKPTGSGEVAIDGGGAMALVTGLGGELRGKDGIAARGVDEEFRLERCLLPVVMGGVGNDAAAIGKLDAGNPATLDHFGPGGGGVLQQHMVELRSSDLVGGIEALVPALSEVEMRWLIMPRRDKFDAVFGDAYPGDLFRDAEFVEQRHVHRQQRLADVEPGVMVFLKQHNARAAACQQGRDGGPCRASADHNHVPLLCRRICHCLGPAESGAA